MDLRSFAARLQRRLSATTSTSNESAGALPPPPPVPDHELLKQIGSGSYGGVWLARSAAGQLRAVKAVWRNRFSSNRPYEREFNGIRQFEPISRSHPGVMNILHVGRDDREGCFYYVMELADSVPSNAASSEVDYEPRTLASDLKSRGPLPLTEVLTLGVQLADALGHLHRHRLVHRDVKPSNVIFVGGHAKLADIGLVTGTDEAKSFVGTEGFIPPEGPGSARADIFGLGRLLYEAATGKDRCDFPELPNDLDTWSPPEREGLLELNEILTRACAPSSAHRHANAAELAGDLNLLLAGRSIRRTYGIEQRLKRATRIVGLAVALALLAVGAVWFLQAQRRRAEERAANEALLRGRAEQAESLAREQLRKSLLHQAHALTSSSEPDARTHALAALGEAAKIRPGIDLRDAAIAALSKPELRVIRRWNPRRSGSLEAQPDTRLQRYFNRNSDGTVSIHSIDDDGEILRLPRIATDSNYGTFSPDGSWLAVCYRDQRVRLWNLPSRTERFTVEPVKTFAFTPDSQRLIAISLDGYLQLFDLASGREIARRTVHPSFHILGMHPTESLLLVAGYPSRQLQIRRTGDGSLERTFDLPEMGFAGRWSVDGKSLITSHLDFSARVWDWPSMRAPRLLLRSHRAEPTTLATDPSGRWLITAGWDNRAAVIDLRNGRQIFNPTAQMVYDATDRPAFLLVNESDWKLVEMESAFAFEAIVVHERDKGPRDAVFSPSGRWLATGGPEGVRIVDWRTREVHRVTDSEETNRLAFTEDSTQIRSITPNGPRAWRVETDRSTGRPHTVRVALPDGVDRLFEGLRTGGIFGNGERWVFAALDPRTGQRSWIQGSFDSREVEPCAELSIGGNDPVVSSDGQWLAWGNWHTKDATVTRLGGGSPPVVLPVTGSATVAFSPDSRLLAVGSAEEIRFHEVGTWRTVHALPRKPSRPMPPQFAFTRDSSVCAISLPPDRILVVDATSWTELATLLAEEHFLSRPSFSPDGRLLAAASTDHHVLIWDLEKLRGKLRELGLDWQTASAAKH